MRGVFFDHRVATVARSPYRADVALFVGFVDRRRAKHDDPTSATPDALVETIVPDDDGHGPNVGLYRWLVAESWARGDRARDLASELDELVNIPIPIDSFETFERLFAWRHRPLGKPPADPATHPPPAYCDTYLGAAVRSFFAHGGRLCYVVRAGSPPVAPLVPGDTPTVAERTLWLDTLVPKDASPAAERSSWGGVWTVFGLPDVSFLALPDLSDVVRADIVDLTPPDRPVGAVGFAECTEPPVSGDDGELVRAMRAPVTKGDGYTTWAEILRRLVDEIQRPRAESGLRELQLVAAVPRPAEDEDARNMLAMLGALALPETAFLQLAYPWLGTSSSSRLAQGIEPPDGVLCGVLAANALERGTYRSAGGRALIDVVSAEPLQMRDVGDPSDLTTLGARVTLLGRAPLGFEVLSDVTTSTSRTWRLAQTNRLVGALARALRMIGEGIAFEASNERTWADVAARARDVLREFWRAGALHGEREGDAFSVRCDRTTMTQSDLDSGRLIAEISIDVAVSIQRLDVTLTRNGSIVGAERAA